MKRSIANGAAQHSAHNGRICGTWSTERCSGRNLIQHTNTDSRATHTQRMHTIATMVVSQADSANRQPDASHIIMEHHTRSHTCTVCQAGREHAHASVGIMEKQNDAQVAQCGQLRDLRRDGARELIGEKIPAVPRRSAPIRTHASAREAKNRPAQAHTSAMPILATVGDARPHQQDKAPLSYDWKEDPKPRPRTHATCNMQHEPCTMQHATLV